MDYAIVNDETLETDMTCYEMLNAGFSLKDVSRAITRQDMKRVTIPCGPPEDCYMPPVLECPTMPYDPKATVKP